MQIRCAAFLVALAALLPSIGHSSPAAAVVALDLVQTTPTASERDAGPASRWANVPMDQSRSMTPPVTRNREPTPALKLGSSPGIPRYRPTMPQAATVDVHSSGATGDGATDDSPAIQAVLDSAVPGSVIYFPPAASHYRLTSALHVRKPLTIIGALPGAVSELRQVTPGQHGIVIESSGVSIERLHLTGPGYTSFKGDSALFIRPAAAQRLTNLTVLDSHLQGWSNSGIRWTGVDDFIIAGNHVEDCTYAGVLLISGQRGIVADNEILDIGAPTEGQPLVNAYSISVTSEMGLPYSQDVIVRGNQVTGNPIWSGIMNHGGIKVLVDSNKVSDADVAYALTWVPNSGIGSDDTLFVNNVAVNAPRNSLWLTGADDRPNRRARVIGNRFSDSASIIVYNTDDATVTWNSATGTVGPHGALRTRLANTLLTVAGNEWNGAGETGDGKVLTYAAPPAVPSAPQELTAARTNGRIVLRWAFDRSIPHDSFLIERRDQGGEWRPLAYRPPNDGLWDFAAPSNPRWIAFDPLTYAVDDTTDPDGEQFRVRALLGGSVSAWSPVATAT